MPKKAATVNRPYAQKVSEVVHAIAQECRHGLLAPIAREARGWQEARLPDHLGQGTGRCVFVECLQGGRGPHRESGRYGLRHRRPQRAWATSRPAATRSSRSSSASASTRLLRRRGTSLSSSSSSTRRASTARSTWSTRSSSRPSAASRNRGRCSRSPR